jgi:hypothetical protein
MSFLFISKKLMGKSFDDALVNIKRVLCFDMVAYV